MRKKINLLYTTCFLDISGVTAINFEILIRLGQTFNVSVAVTEYDEHLERTWDDKFKEVFGDVQKFWKQNSEKSVEFFADFLKRTRIDLIYNTHSIWVYEHAVALKKAVPNLKIIDSLHVLEPFCLRGGYPDISCNRFVHPHIDRTILISQDLTNYLEHHYAVDKKKIDIVRNGIDLRRFRRKEEYTGAFKRELGLPEDVKLIGFIGRLASQKRPLFFLEIAECIAALKTNIYFYIVGDGSQRGKVLKRIRKMREGRRVIYLPSRNDIPYVLSSTDLLLVPSIYEGAPLTILESLATGVPVLASDVGAVREYMADMIEYVAAADRDKLDAFVSKSLTLLENPPTKETLISYVQRNHDIEATAKSYQEIFLRICD